MILIAVASSSAFQPLNAQMMDAEDPIQVQAVNLPPSPPPASPEYDYAEPEALPEPAPPPEPIQPPPEVAEAPAPVSTPTPRPQPTPTPTPQPSAPPDAGTEAPQPSATPSPDTSAEPPSPEPSASVQVADLPPAEQTAKDSVAELLKNQGLDVPEELPFGFKSWGEYQEFMVGYEQEAKRLGQLPSNTQGSEASAGESTPENNGSPAPDGNTPRNGIRFGNFGQDLDKASRNIRRFDPSLDNPFGYQPRINTELDIRTDRFGDDQGLTEEEKALERARRNLGQLDLDLSVPSPTPIPLPHYETGDLGALQYLTFTYDQLTFRVQWSAEDNADKKVNARYFPPSQPSQIQTLELPWRSEWENNTQALVQAVLQAYEARKAGR